MTSDIRARGGGVFAEFRRVTHQVQETMFQLLRIPLHVYVLVFFVRQCRACEGFLCDVLFQENATSFTKLFEHTIYLSYYCIRSL